MFQGFNLTMPIDDPIISLCQFCHQIDIKISSQPPYNKAFKEWPHLANFDQMYIHTAVNIFLDQKNHL